MYDLLPADHPYSKLVFEDFGLCGCGDPESVVLVVYGVLSLLKAREGDMTGEEAYNKINTLLGENHEALEWLFWYVLDNKGFTEHGGSVSYSYLTDKGDEALDVLKGALKEGIFTIDEEEQDGEEA